MSGRVEAIFLSPEHGELPDPVDRVHARAGRGLEGNRYYWDDGAAPPGCAITLIASEAVEAVASEGDVSVEPAATRRNVLTRGIDVNALVGQALPHRQRGVRRRRALRAVHDPGVDDAARGDQGFRPPRRAERRHPHRRRDQRRRSRHRRLSVGSSRERRRQGRMRAGRAGRVRPHGHDRQARRACG